MNPDKHCPGCNTTKPRAAFAKHANTYDQLQGECRACNSIRRKNAPVTRPPRGQESSRPVDVDTVERVEQRRALKRAIRTWLDPIFKRGQS